MRKQVYISADYDRLNGDQDVVNELRHHRTIVSAAFAQSFAPSVQG